ncbi:MAG TPA: glycosyltransferase family 2 protein [Acholeplasma sp.]|jgi:glycosyltransferase involved in cell wall biosynthesis|nr:glycosyltransferase family 2 protein [Acholeplasma sp.]
MSKISVIVPVYNTSKYLEKCLNSIRNQTYENIEIIVVNDGSTDNSLDILNEISKKDKRIKVISQENGGLSKARNTGLEHATGSYVGFIDSDDYIDPNMYETMLRAMKQNNVRLATSARMNVFDTYSTSLFTLDKETYLPIKEAYKSILTWKNMDVSFCDKLFDIELFKNKRFPLGKLNEDVYLLFELLNELDGIIHVAKPFYYYLQRGNSITTSSFSLKKLDLLDANASVRKLVLDRFPDLIKFVNAYEYSGILYLYRLIRKSNAKKEYPNEYKRLRKLFYRNFYKNVFNKHLSLIKKRNAILLYLGIL